MKRFLPLALSLGLASWSLPAQAALYSWVGGTTGSWETTTNWSSNPSLPGSSDTASIGVIGGTEASVSTVTLTAAETINELDVYDSMNLTIGDTASQALTINSAFKDAAGKITFTAPVTLGSGGVTLTNTGAGPVYFDSTVSGGNLDVTGSAATSVVFEGNDSSWTGGLTVANASSIDVEAASNALGSGPVSITGSGGSFAFLSFTGANQSVNNNFTIANTEYFYIGNGSVTGGQTTLGGNLVGSGASTDKLIIAPKSGVSAPNTVVLDGANTDASSGSNMDIYGLAIQVANNQAFGWGTTLIGSSSNAVAANLIYLNNGITLANNILVADNDPEGITLGTLATSATASFAAITVQHSAGSTISESPSVSLTAGAGSTVKFGLLSEAASTYDTLSVTTAGSGTINFTAPNTYHGTTTVNAGTTLQVDNASGSGTGTGAVTVDGTLSGTGIVAPGGTNGISLVGGIVSPGDANIGKLTFKLTSGGATFNSASSFTFDLATGSQLAFTSVSSLDTVAFNGNALNFTGAVAPGTYTLFTFDNASGTDYSGTLALGSGLGSYASSSSVVYNPNNIQLDVISAPEPSTATLLGCSVGALVFFARRKLPRA